MCRIYVKKTIYLLRYIIKDLNKQGIHTMAPNAKNFNSPQLIYKRNSKQKSGFVNFTKIAVKYLWQNKCMGLICTYTYV